jgi:hypothetical protein
MNTGSEGAARANRLSSLSLWLLCLSIVLHMLTLADTPLRRQTMKLMASGVLGHAMWLFPFAWLAMRTFTGQRLKTAMGVLCVNGFMVGLPTVLFLTGAMKYVGGWLSIATSVFFWMCWGFCFISLCLALRNRSTEPSVSRSA